MNQEKTAFSLKMNKKVLKKLNELSKQHNITKSRMVNYALKYSFSNKDLTLKLE